MISVDVKSDKSSSSPLNLSSTQKKTTSSFSDLLRGASEKKDAKVIQNGALVLDLSTTKNETKSVKTVSKSDALLSLLKNEKIEKSETKELLELNPKFAQTLSVQEMKVLVKDAKNYLKSQILESVDYKKSQIKDLPKTLKGLVELAKKVGIDIYKISVEEVQAKKTPLKADLKAEVPHAKEAAFKAEVKTEVKAEIPHAKEVALKTEVKAEIPHAKEKEVALKTEVKTEVPHAKETEVALKTEVKTEVPHAKETAFKAEAKTEVKAEIPHAKEVALKAEIKAEVPHAKEVASKAEPKIEVPHAKDVQNLSKEEPKQEVPKLETKLALAQEEGKSIPLFKAQKQVEHTTEQIVQAKQFKVEEKTPKEKADETLKLLLRGEKASQSSTALTADFSVATARVLAPTATSEATKAIEKLLHGESSDAKSETTNSKLDGLTAPKTADSFEVKLNEAKQMMKYLSSDVKTAIEDYKSPFTRVKIQLNPQKLGEVDLTIVQRGKNLHVNLSSNNAAINTLSMNVNELRTQLSNNGINNATFNFSNQSDSSNSSSQQQSRQHGRQAEKEYSYFENEESNERVLSSLEIIVPQYV
ncbi:MAG: flagellar hook-length control protein FliK [Sulfurimonas sp. CG_4_10_14_3_um_filter_36_910]|nr:MAG: flagellar hook-length control protein FliK [Sulfurimonas sp. CG_4_10_14_3_um_filter_36_910]